MLKCGYNFDVLLRGKKAGRERGQYLGINYDFSIETCSESVDIRAKDAIILFAAV